jgi:cytochrome c oxidase cbb3-type subunit III
MSNALTKPSSSLAISLLIATIALVVTACWVIARGADLPGKPKASDRPVPPTDILDFKALYSTHCAGCHGPDGQDGPAPPLAGDLFRALIPEDVLKQVISAGRSGTPMPGFDNAHGGPLTAEQIDVLVYQIKGVRIAGGSVSFAWGEAAAAADVPPYVSPAGSSSAGSEQSRMAIYAQACGKCHGEHGEGGDQAGPINDPDFLALTSDQMLRRIIITGRSDLGMSAYDDSEGRGKSFKPLTSSEIDQIVALLAEWRHAGNPKPPGSRTSSLPSQEPGRAAAVSPLPLRERGRG